MKYLVYFISVIFTVSSYILTIKNSFFGLISDPTTATLASLGFSILIFMIIEKISTFMEISNLKESINEEIDKKFSGIPIFNIITEYKTADEAMEYLCSKLPLANTILNTKISKDTIHVNNELGKRYKKTLKECIKNGLTYKDVISNGFEEYKTELELYSKGLTGKYICKNVDIDLSCFINFIILIYKNGEKELLIGWATSAYNGTEIPAYKISDSRIISYFEDYHMDLSK
jgi:hypothetical protein